MMDLKFNKKYNQLYETIEDGKCEIYEFVHELGIIRNIFIKKAIPIKINDLTYFDLVTPSAYGGPIIIKCLEGSRKKLLSAFEQAFSLYCEKNQIICEFAHFHPILKNANDFKNSYELQYIGISKGVDLRNTTFQDLEELYNTFKLKNNVYFRVTAKPDRTAHFKELFFSIYLQDKKEVVSEFENFAARCFGIYPNNIVIVEAIYKSQVIGISLYFLDNGILQIQLSALLNAYSSLMPEYIMQYGITLWGMKNEVDFIHYGGGKTIIGKNEISSNRKKNKLIGDYDFYVGKKVWNENIYKKLCAAAGMGGESIYFPAYRVHEYLTTVKE